MYSWLLRLERQGIGHRSGHRLLAVDVGQGEDLAHMRQGIAAPLQQAGVVLRR